MSLGLDLSPDEQQVLDRVLQKYPAMMESWREVQTVHTAKPVPLATGQAKSDGRQNGHSSDSIQSKTRGGSIAHSGNTSDAPRRQSVGSLPNTVQPSSLGGRAAGGSNVAHHTHLHTNYVSSSDSDEDGHKARPIPSFAFSSMPASEAMRSASRAALPTQDVVTPPVTHTISVARTTSSGTASTKRRRPSLSDAATQVGSPVGMILALSGLGLFFAYPIIWMELMDEEVHTVMPCISSGAILALIITGQLVWGTMDCTTKIKRFAKASVRAWRDRRCCGRVPVTVSPMARRNRVVRRSHTSLRCHLAEEECDEKTLRGRINMAMNNDLYEAYQLAVSCLGVSSWVYYSYNVSVVTDGTATHYELTGMSTAGRSRFYEREVFLVVSMAADVLLRVMTAKEAWKTLMSYYVLIEVVMFFFVAYYQPLVVSTGLNSLTVYSLYLMSGPLRILRMRRAVKALDSRRVGFQELTLGPFTMKATTAEVIVVATRVVLYVLACAAIVVIVEFPCVPEMLIEGRTYHQAEQLCDSGLWEFHRAVYFVVVTLSTVGYGDLTPATSVGQLMTASIIVIGLIQVPVQINEMAAFLTESGGKESDTAKVLRLVEDLVDDVQQLRLDVASIGKQQKKQMRAANSKMSFFGSKMEPSFGLRSRQSV